MKGVERSSATERVLFAPLWITVTRVGRQTRVAVDASHAVRNYWPTALHIRPVAPARSPALCAIPSGGAVHGVQLDNVDFQIAAAPATASLPGADAEAGAEAEVAWSDPVFVEAPRDGGESAQLLSVNGRERVWCVARCVTHRSTMSAAATTQDADGEFFVMFSGNFYPYYISSYSSSQFDSLLSPPVMFFILCSPLFHFVVFLLTI